MVKVVITPEATNNQRDKISGLAKAITRELHDFRILYPPNSTAFETARALEKELVKLDKKSPIKVEADEILYRTKETIATYLLEQANAELKGYEYDNIKPFDLILVLEQKAANSFPSYFAQHILHLKAGVAQLEEGKAVLFEFSRGHSPHVYYEHLKCIALP